MSKGLRALFAICLLIPAYWLLQVAQWICPEIKDSKNDKALCWLDAAKGWEDKAN